MLLIRYLLVAGLAYGIDFGGYILLLRLDCSPVAANAYVKVVAAIFGFFAHRYFTYSIKGRDGIRKHAVRYFGLAFFYTPTSSICLYIIMLFLPSPVYAKIISDVLLFILVFWITSKFAFIKDGPQHDLKDSETLLRSSGGRK